ncbi:MAG: tetratricopeptide repeat protein, partial [Rivularia sp. ALOHA_DT_140]|nr:tetratricopeptide repeat protein [Rivularia sp. ALOHA_DT_140]
MSRNNTSKLLSFIQPSGVELNINLVLSEKLSRQNQKLQTLTQYVQKYPSGSKKRLELADLLYAMGRLEQAVEQYHQVLVKQPQLIEVWLKLGKILQLMGKTAEAIEVYESALSVETSSSSPLL